MSPSPSLKSDFEGTAVNRPERHPAAGINILIVDDDPKNLTVLETILEDSDYRLVRASSGDEALLALIDREFALLILDIQMPGMTGFELAQIIKKRKKTAHVPIIFLTAYYNEDSHVLEGYDTGAVDYLYKPVNPIVLRSKVAVFADLHRKGREAAAANELLRGEVEARQRAEEQLWALNHTLEDRVLERTQELRQQTERLRRANEALEQFAYAASHDLQEPLRNVSLFSELLRNRHSTTLNEEACGYLEVITEGAQRMIRLVSGLLEYAQADNLGEAILSSDGEAVFLQVLKNLDLAVQECGAIITHDPLPAVPVNEIHLEQLLQNLIGNALKYRKDGDAPRVRVSAALEDGSWHFSVADNGIGIEPEYHEKIFGVFKRLQSSRTKPSTGIGLAICKRIVGRYGGRIWVESEIARGATFHFTIPAPSLR